MNSKRGKNKSQGLRKTKKGNTKGSGVFGQRKNGKRNKSN